jgi:hypothetical protein
MMTKTEATYTKLKNGDWGLRLAGAIPKPGAPVLVTKKDGSTRTERIGRILWQGDGVALATIERRPRLDHEMADELGLYWPVRP